MLTAAVRDLHRRYPGRFVTDVRTPCPALWENNPHLTPLASKDPGVDLIECGYPLIERANRSACHCLHGFIQFLNQRLDLQIQLSAFQGDIHLSDEEKSAPSQVAEMVGEEIPYWLIVAGGKFDATIKWWDIGRFQDVVDHFRGRIQFVQVGQLGHYHPPLNGVIDLRGATTLRGLVRLVHHAQGVLCPVTCAMHLAAAVQTRPGQPPHRPCVVVAGGREPSHWEAYPHHQYLHTVGALSCCSRGGCWRSRTEALGDGQEQDREENLCLDRVGRLPRCMDLITPRQVIDSIGLYFEGGHLRYLGRDQARVADVAVPPSDPNPGPEVRLDRYNARTAADHFLKTVGPPPEELAGRGIVICAGGPRLLTCAWVCIHMLRRVGCRLPIEVWHMGEDELDDGMRALLEPLGVRCVDAEQVRARHPVRRLGGWPLKPYAMIHSAFREVLLLDADNVPVQNPESLFSAEPYRQTGAVFWPDRERWEIHRPIWEFAGVPYRDEPAFESGQILIDKHRCWKPLQLAMWYNEHSDFFYQHVYGDKDTFRLAFRRLGMPWAMPSSPSRFVDGVFYHPDLDGHELFQHRIKNKWNLFLNHHILPDFRHEKDCIGYVRDLRRRWAAGMDRIRSRRQGSEIAALHAGFRAETDSPPRILPVMLSCPAREAVRNQTLESLRRSDLAGLMPRVRVDDRNGGRPKENQARNAHRLMRESLAEPYEYLLFLEDDLMVNGHLLANLRKWRLLQRGEIAMATLFNPGFRAMACDVENDALVVDPERYYGALALVLSRPTVQYMVEHWESETGAHDTRMGRLLARLREPVYVHTPSLVQHTGEQSTWGNGFILAANFQPAWKR